VVGVVGVVVAFVVVVLVVAVLLVVAWTGRLLHYLAMIDYQQMLPDY
jgi:hypothetical protein